MPCGVLMQWGVETGQPHSPLKTPCRKLAPLKSCAFLRRAQASSLDSTSTAALENKRDYALSALAVLGWYRREGCGSVEVRARMVCLLITWHARVTLSQVVDEHCSSRTARIYDRTSVAQLHLVMTRSTAMQCLAALCLA